MARKIVHLTSVHKADDVRIYHKECRSLRQAGYEVVLIARADQDSIKDDVRIRALGERGGGRIGRMTATVFEVLRMAVQERADAYHFHDPELIFVGILLRLMGKRVVYDVHEDVPKQIRSKSWIPKPLRAPISWAVGGVERAGSAFFDGIVAATPHIARSFPSSKTILVQNFAMMEEFSVASGVPYRDRELKVAYVGGITEIRAVLEMVRAIEIVASDRNARLLLGGQFESPQLESRASQENGWRFVDHLGWLTRQQVVDVYHQCRAGLLLFHSVPNHMDAVPNKLFEYMAAGLPVIASNLPQWKQFIDEIGSGIMVDPKDPNAIADAVIWLLDHPDEAEAMGARGQDAVMSHYTWNGEATKLIEFYRTRVLN